MILDSLTAAASDNLKHTYFELGRSAVNAKILREPGFQACVGEFEHPICNFAAGLDLDRWSAERLARIALDRTMFNVYVTPNDKPEDLGELLVREGFFRSYRLLQMVAEPGEVQPRGSLVRAATRYDRLQIALFMVDQFFNKYGQSFRQQVAETTARATSLELLSMRRDGKILAAAMVCFANGMAGVYNVCVDAGFRGLGLGTALMREILAVCAVKNAPATLQCDAKLEPWYRELGFRRSGEIDVYALPKPATVCYNAV
ncbi:MAG TPA: GNAT family N-acetyltransferase [Fimbriimonadaceae bacterium]|nr:GNAT family N-acetyltransferase [Fimbriimonadaceae bacterium]